MSSYRSALPVRKLLWQGSIGIRAIGGAPDEMDAEHVRLIFDIEKQTFLVERCEHDLLDGERWMRKDQYEFCEQVLAHYLRLLMSGHEQLQPL